MRPKLRRQINGRKQTFEKRMKLAVFFVVIFHISNDSTRTISRHSPFKQVDLRGPLCRLTIVIFSGIGNKIIRWRPFFPKIS